jgi:hypothetical protein
MPVVQLAHFQVWWAACILTIACPQVHVVYNQQFWGTTRAIWRVLFLPGVRGEGAPLHTSLHWCSGLQKEAGYEARPDDRH